MNRYKVVITDFITDSLEPEKRILGDLADVVAFNCFNEDELPGRIEDADGIMLYHNLALSRKTIERLNRCKLIVRCGVGFDNVAHAFARSRGITVANVPDYGNEEVADSAIGLMLALTRGIHQLNSRLRANIGEWRYVQVAPLYRLRGRVFGVVGLGRIGTAAALRAKALGMNVLFFDPYKPCGYDKALGITRVESLNELLAQSDIISLHCDLTDETHHLLDRKTIARAPAGSFLINTARGAVIDTAALPEFLATGHLAGVGLDVLEQEPPSSDDPLIVAWRDPRHPAHHRLIINPHSAFYSEEGLMDMRTKGSDACRRALLGQPIPNVVN
jgi:D-3-phosphoglycerate dehydrogenase/C-terminal binding protein